MFVFINFNPVLFAQYFVWLIPFVSLVIYETINLSEESTAQIIKKHPKKLFQVYF